MAALGRIAKIFKVKDLKKDDGYYAEGEMTKSENVGVRSEAAEALGKIGDERAIEALIEALKAEMLVVQRNEEKARGDIAKWQITRMKVYDVRRNAAKALGKIGDDRAVEPLLILALEKEKDFDVDFGAQREAKEALRNMGELAVKHLIKALKDENSYVRFNAAIILKNEIDWQPKNDDDKAWYLVGIQHWIEAIELGKPAVLPLIHALKYGDPRGDIQEAAAEALGKIGDERAAKPLIEVAYRPFCVCEEQRKAAKALINMGKLAVEPLIQALKDRDGHVRREAAKALGEIGDTRAIEPLIHALKDDQGQVQENAAMALGKIGDKRAAEAVMSYLFGNIYHTIICDRIHSKTIENIFCRYTHLIIGASAYRRNYHTDADGHTIYNYIPDFTAIETLCKIHTPISNNILHQIAQLRDIKVSTGYSCGESFTGTLSFEPHRKMAREELERRGNPPYNPSAYLDDKAWNL